MPAVTESQLKKQIKSGEFSPLYVLWGDEKKYVRAYTNQLAEKIAGKEPSEFNFHRFGGEFNINEICMCMLTVPFASDFNLLIISDMDVNVLSKEDREQLFKALEDIPQGTVVIFTMPTLAQDSKKPGEFKKLLAIADKHGASAEFKKMGDMALEKHLSSLASRNGAALSRVNADLIINYCGNDLNTLINELDKLCAYVGEGGEITKEAIDLLVTKNFEARVFSLADAVITGKSDDAVKILDALFYQREDPIAILTVLSNAYIDFYRGRVADECGVQTSVIAQEFNYRNRAFVLKKKTALSTEGLRDSLDLLIEADGKMKSTSQNPKITLEKLVCKLLIIAKKGRAYA